jgi:site-specific DNA-methyltransferase (adenine-specific)
MAENVLYYGGNLEILRRYIKDESVDLVYLDPPFKSDQDYNILFAERNGSQAAAHKQAWQHLSLDINFKGPITCDNPYNPHTPA